MDALQAHPSHEGVHWLREVSNLGGGTSPPPTMKYNSRNSIMVNEKAIKELVQAEIQSDKLARIEMFSDRRPLTQDEEYRVESLRLLIDDIKEGMSSEDIDTAFDMYGDYGNLSWYLYAIESGDVKEWQELRKKHGAFNCSD